MTIDFHSHTSYSFDSMMHPAKALAQAKVCGLDGLAVTDHETIAGGVHMEALNDDPYFTVIVGAEITSDIGDIIGLFLTHEIRSRKWPDVVQEIHDQGGLVYLPHPYRSHRLNDQLIAAVDVIEVFNARTRPELNERAGELARQTGKPAAVGSDAHFPSEIARCKNILPSRDIRAEMLKGIATFETIASPSYISAASEVIMRAKLGQYQKLPGSCVKLAGKYLGMT